MPSKVPIETLPVELRIKIYELGDVKCITSYDWPPWRARPIFKFDGPWSRTIIMSGILNDKDAIEIAAIQEQPPRLDMCSYLALSGNLPMIKWARSDKSSARKDETDVEERSMKQLRLTPFPWNTETCRNAAKFGHFKLLQWLHENGCPWDNCTFGCAAYFGDIAILEWLYQKKCPWDRSTFYHATKSGTLDVLKWLHERKCPWCPETFHVAVCTGNLVIVEWLHEQKCPWNKEYGDINVAAGKGNLTMLKWLVDHGHPMHTSNYDSAVFTSAAEGRDDLEIVKWLREQGCPWDTSTCAYAAFYGTFEILKWLHEQGCPWDGTTLTYAKNEGHDDIYSWALSNGCPDDYVSDTDEDDLIASEDDNSE